MFVEWNESYAIGIDEVDRQHRELFSRFETVIEAIGTGKGKEELLPLLGFLDTYTATHFHQEEELHRANHYPRAGFHGETHAVFLDKLDALKKDLEARGISNLLVIQAARTLFRWLVDHVCSMDRDFGEFMKKGGSEKVLASGVGPYILG